MNFNPHIALAYAASLARPRRVGSGLDAVVADEIAAQLCGWGYQVDRQPFTFSTAPELLLKAVILASLLLVLTMLFSHERWPAVADLAALLLVILIGLFMPLNRRVQARAWRGTLHNSSFTPGLPRLLKRYTTANLIAQLPLPERADVPHLFLVAHYDSKSQRMPLVMRLTLFMLAISAGLILVGLTLLHLSSALYLPIGLLAVAAACPLLFLDVGNNSPGAIDNASSVGLVLHLAEVLAQRTDWQDKLRLTILLPSAEELTLMGSVAYVTVHADALRRQAGQGGLAILNFDGIGVDGGLYYVGRPGKLRQHVQQACRDLTLPLKRFAFVGALFDSIPFAQRGFDALSLMTVGRASRSVHTPRDAVDQLHVRGFDQAGCVALRVIEQLTHL